MAGGTAGVGENKLPSQEIIARAAKACGTDSFEATKSDKKRRSRKITSSKGIRGGQPGAEMEES